MGRWARTWGLALGLGGLVASALAVAGRDRGPGIAPRPPNERPPLMVVTSLPLLFPEEFSIGAGGSKALTALETRYRVIPVATTDGASLRQGRLLLMAHPLAQTAEGLVELDAWVRGGGRVLILADPKLEWPSKLPLGDRLRPPPAFADTGLLAHWGLRLDAPEQSGPAAREIGGKAVLTVSPGSLSGSCAIGSDHIVARCEVGRGRATVVADADLLNVEGLGDGARGNLDALLLELATLERRPTH